MKKVLLILAALALLGSGYYLATSHTTSAQAASHSNLTGIAFIAGHGGHLAMINLADMKSPTDIQDDRVVITEPGSEMEGTVAGLHIEDVKRQGGIHGSALIGQKLYVGMLDGSVVTYDLATGVESKKVKVGSKFCDAVIGPGGKHIYFEDMADGHVYEFDYKTMKLADKIPVGASVCGIQWTKNRKYAYVSGMPDGTVYVLDWKTKKIVQKIHDDSMTFLHQIRMTPDGKQLWVTSGNEFDPGLKPGTHTPEIVVIDTATNKIIDHIMMPGMGVHDVVFSPDGNTALVTERDYGHRDSSLILMDAKTHEVQKKISVCYSCHGNYGIKVRMDNGDPLLCGLTVAWGMKQKPKMY
ncbi:MAG: YncE family protein [Nitrospiraceae bacterium]|nr:YncE family protein [Nitrospiraceae bacterium]